MTAFLDSDHGRRAVEAAVKASCDTGVDTSRAVQFVSLAAALPHLAEAFAEDAKANDEVTLNFLRQALDVRDISQPLDADVFALAFCLDQYTNGLAARCAALELAGKALTRHAYALLAVVEANAGGDYSKTRLAVDALAALLQGEAK